jgi:hypothetical protein
VQRTTRGDSEEGREQQEGTVKRAENNKNKVQRKAKKTAILEQRIKTGNEK